jgi:HlyD family secretion protein
VHVTIWRGQNVLMVPVGALFRLEGSWAVFAMKDGRARATRIEVGHRNDQAAEVLSGLSEGDRVVLHPSDRVTDGKRITERTTD